jgi:uridine phosphorylase
MAMEEIEKVGDRTLCRYGSLHGQAAAVMQACEKAVTLAPKNG